MQYIDTHAHYYDEKFNDDRDSIIKKIRQSGVTKCFNVGCDIKTTLQTIELSKKYDFMYSICGIHPSEIALNNKKIDEDIDKLKNIIKSNKKIVAVGEIGLDYHYEDSPDKNLQKYAFIKQIELANSLKLPISIHTRDAIDDTIAIIKNNIIQNFGVLHCCPFNRELVKHGLEQNLYIAFGGTVTFKNAKNAKEIVEMVPIEKILIETDSPYLSPEPFRGERNDSSKLKYIVQKIAQFKNVSEEKMAEITFENARRLFKC